MNYIDRLRNALREQGFKACVIPNSDPHLSEYIPQQWAMLHHFSGFSGSNGTLIVTDQTAALWTDSRYYLQAEQQLHGSEILLMKAELPTTPSIYTFLSQHLVAGDRLLLPALLFAIQEIKQYDAALTPQGIELNYSIDTLLAVWHNRPQPSPAPLYLQNEAFSGESCIERLQRIRQSLRQNQANSMIISDLAEIAWLFNIRGSDIPCNPVALAYAFVSLDEAILFVEPSKITTEVHDYLAQQGVVCADYSRFFFFLTHLNSSAPILLDPSRINEAIRQQLPTSHPILALHSPIALLKAIKNETEINGLRQAMIKDGAALCRFFHWFERFGIGQTEYSITEKITQFREEQPLFVGDSFPTIAGFRSNGAIVHYHPQPDSSLTIENNGLLLIDTGGQYFDGTTDITRTIAPGSPSKQQQHDYTLVLKGHIALSQIRFPQGTRGGQLDSIARQPLWKNGLNYGHGTGHGVGHFLNVHEGPQSIRPDLNPTPLEPGMILSNEPGLYREGEYGIRIENLVVVIPDIETPFGTFFAFETLTLCPYDRRLIDRSLLTNEEISYINSYHQRTLNLLSAQLDPETTQWLSAQCQPL